MWRVEVLKRRRDTESLLRCHEWHLLHRESHGRGRRGGVAATEEGGWWLCNRCHGILQPQCASLRRLRRTTSATDTTSIGEEHYIDLTLLVIAPHGVADLRLEMTGGILRRHNVTPKRTHGR